MEQVYHIDDDVLRQVDAPQGCDVVEQSNVYTALTEHGLDNSIPALDVLNRAGGVDPED
ncbi:hypothetical protein [Bradyrhizobium sp. AUGA SZCCT0431]|uniref:hypothetical protein n=1 Tax=Bradyrhizobium sp. AUGA SZCCT0431 TaxID=2807674 RepID=UPI001BA69CAD|nr:hypothetical protein [Bradyrhizobium sp. AUGA SZCCT0431]